MFRNVIYCGGGPVPNSFSWKEPYLAALKETDQKRLTDLTYAAEEAIFFRLGELEGSTDHHEERNELKATCDDLMTIRVSKLGWPPLISG
jgi:hypothetical protein